MSKKIGILTAGGDCPGLNAAIRGVGKTAIKKYDMKLYGFRHGFKGLIENNYIELNSIDLSNILTIGGTILGTSREKPFKVNEDEIIDKPELIKKHYEELGLDCVVCIGGNGTQKTANKLSEMGINVIGIPKTIDNDLFGTDLTFGFDSALTVATEAIDRLHSTANSHGRIMVIEIMGHKAGWLALEAGIAGGGDIILIPELGYDLEVISETIKKRFQEGHTYSIVVVAEGIKTPKKSPGRYFAKMINEMTGFETRETVLGYTQRGGTPTAYDRVLATQYGSYAAELIAEGRYNEMVALKNNEIISVPLSEIAGLLKTVPEDHPLIENAKSIGTCFGIR